MSKKTKKGRLFNKLPPEARAEKVRALMEAGHSNKTAAVALGTTLGTVVGIRRKYGIPSLNPQGGAASVAAPKPATVEDTERPQPPFKPAASEATQCIERVTEYQCGYEQEPGSDRCRLHNWLLKSK